MSVAGWHTCRLPGGVTPKAVKVVEEAVQWRKDQGATSVHLVKIDEHHYRMIDFRLDRATHEKADVSMQGPAVRAMGKRIQDAIHFGYLEGHFQDGDGDVVASR